METKAELLKIWESWLSPKSQYLKILHLIADDIIFRDLGGGLPRPNSLLPFAMIAYRNGQKLAEINCLKDLKNLIPKK
jgi:hypothetical protein